MGFCRGLRADKLWKDEKVFYKRDVTVDQSGEVLVLYTRRVHSFSGDPGGSHPVDLGVGKNDCDMDPVRN